MFISRLMVGPAFDQVSWRDLPSESQTGGGLKLQRLRSILNSSYLHAAYHQWSFQTEALWLATRDLATRHFAFRR